MSINKNSSSAKRKWKLARSLNREFFRMLNEDLTTSAEPNIATRDFNFNISSVYQELDLPSLGRKMLPVIQMNGPTGKVFNVRQKSTDPNDIEIVSSVLEVLPCTSIRTGITQEALYDIFSLQGAPGIVNVSKALRGRANTVENEALVSFLNTNASDEGTLTLSDELNAETQMFELTNKVQSCVLKGNSLAQRTFGAFALVPYEFLAPIMTTSQYTLGVDTSSFDSYKCVQIGLTKYYINPVTTDTNVYVGLVDTNEPHASCAFFGSYQNDLVQTQDPESGSEVFFIFNRFGFAMSPLHTTTKPMLFKFAVTTSTSP